MPKWEYLEVRVGFFGLNGDKVAVQFVNEQELRNWKRIPLHAFINQLGSDGWEMSGTLYTNTLFFKRPKS